MSARADPHPTVPAAAARFRLTRVLPLAVIVLVSVTVIAMGWYRYLSPGALIGHRDAIDAFVAEHQIAALAVFAGVYALAVALSLPGAALLTVCGGVVFGALAGGLAALVGATVGATAIFLIAKSALGGWLVRRAGGRTENLAAGFCADAFHYLLFLRLVPIFPFWLVNLVPALCGVRLMTFITATALGIIPGTFAFAIFGAGLDSAIAVQAAAYRACVTARGTGCMLDFDLSAALTPQLIIGLVALGVLSLAPIAVKRWRASRAPSQSSGSP
jgi:uncharacterized membrane protein YdjX (TVP38/TMEM64 family)